MPFDASVTPAPSRFSNEVRQLWRLAFPIAIAQAGQAMMGLVDTLVVGRAGTEALAAAGLGNNLYFAVSSFGMGLMMGFDPLLSQALGAGNPGRARELLRQAAWMALFAGMALCALLWWVPDALHWIPRMEPQVIEQVRAYMLWRAPGVPLMLAFMAARSYLQANANPRPLVVATVVANICNFLFDLLLVFGGARLPEWCGPLRRIPAMGVEGAALATLLCTGVQLLIIMAAVRRMQVPPGTRASWKPVWADIFQGGKLGTPIGLHIAAEVGVFSLASLLAATLGKAEVGAHQIAISYASLTFTVAVGVGNAGSVRVGWAVGARDTPQARLSGFVAFASGAAFMSLMGLGFAVFPEQLGALSGAPPEVLTLLMPLLVVSAVFQVFDGIQGVGAGVLRGAGETRFTFIANMVGHYFIGLPLTLLLGFHLGLGLWGIWWGLCAGLVFVALALLWRFNRVSAGTLVPVEA
ncbi:MATE family efflux transporter [Corallococcus sp. H22C18031201]|uniref:MATE family efflux transporter n=1 Tax=Citreicoccus inhibens TaxID=2849499 RepID=UPI000E770275|nr:MATE family efflux transporter [Citreicoccus inhibens]MBU8900137.1 MATE family efflux transporter [Citreicoccus inhibens]RJS21777.1 MATE family efflux transporter [Corallococcus sp. H22C18031201]